MASHSKHAQIGTSNRLPSIGSVPSDLEECGFDPLSRLDLPDKVGELKTDHSQRQLPLSPSLANELKRRREIALRQLGYIDNKLVFPGSAPSQSDRATAPFGRAGVGWLHGRKRPRPFAAVKAPSRHTTWPRDSVAIGHPVISIPSYGV